MSKLELSRTETIQALRNQYGEGAAMAWEKANPEERIAVGEAGAGSRAQMTFPVRIVLPWSHLCSDNYRFKASLTRRVGGEVFPRLVHDARFKLALDKTRNVAKGAVGAAAPVAVPLTMHVRVYPPSNDPRDIVNFAKCVGDALEGVVYTNDLWLYRSTWERAGVDVDAPRAEIEILPL